MKNLKVIELKGIDRSGGRFTDQGILQEALNVSKRRSGLYEVIGKKEVFSEYTSDLESFIQLYKFPSLPAKELIGVLTDQKVYRVAPTHTEEILEFDTPSEVLWSISHLGNILVIHTDYRPYHLKYDPTADTFTQVPDLPVPQFYCMHDSLRTYGPYSTELQTTFADAVAEYIDRDAKMRKDGAIEGHILCVLAWRLYDNTYVKHSQIMDCLLGGAGVLCDKTGGYLFKNLIYHKIEGQYYFDTAQRTDLQKWVGIATSLCLFISEPKSLYTIDTDETRYTWAGDDGTPPENKSLKTMDQDTVGFYKVHEMPIADVIGKVGTFKFYPDCGPLDILTTKTPLPIDESTHHWLMAHNAYHYNQRQHYSDIKNKLYLGHNPNCYALDTSNVQVNTTWEFESGTEYAPQVGSEWTAMIVVLLRTSEGEKALIQYFHQGDADITVWEHATLHDMILLNSILSYPDLRAYKIKTYFWQTTGNKYYRGPVYYLTPHPYHNFASFLNYDETAKDIIPIEIDLTGLTEITAEVFNTEAVDIYDREVLDKNRIQVSGLNNPFCFPSANSYRVGTHNNQVLRTCAMGEAISQGQFGEFPLYIFSSQGIYALQVGSGEVLYQSILPLNSDVVSNVNSITNVGAGVVYATSRGLFLISGNQVAELSTAIEGKLDNPVLTHNEYLGYLNTDCLVKLKDYLSDMTFSTYLQSAIIGFDRKNRELIVSFKEYNDLHDWQGSGSGSGERDWPGTGVGIPMIDDASRAGYSYVYSFLNKEWTKITQRWYHFLDAYPDTLGVVGNCVYNLTEESEEANQYLVQTRPITLAQHTFKKILSANLYGHFEPEVNTFHAFYAWGSQDGQKWYLLQGQQQPFSPHEWITIQQASGWCKYFIFLAAGQLSLDSILEHMEIEFDERYKSKLR